MRQQNLREHLEKFFASSVPTFMFGVVRRVDHLKRTVDVAWVGIEGERHDIPFAHSPGVYTPPCVGDTAVILFDNKDVAVCIGFLDPSYGIRLESNSELVDEVKSGETAIVARVRSYDEFSQKLRFLSNGDIQLESEDGSGFLLQKKGDLIKLRASSVVEETAAGRYVNGYVRRTLEVGGISVPEFPMNTEAVMCEQGFVSISPYTREERARFLLGDIVLDNIPFTPRPSKLGSPLIVILETLLDKVPLSRMEMDIMGNIVFETNTGAVVLVGNAISLESKTLLSLKSSSVTVDTLSFTVQSGAVVINSPSVLIGSAPKPLVTADVLALLASHTHPTIDGDGRTCAVSPSPELSAASSYQTSAVLAG